MPIIEGDEDISDVDEDELSLHSSRLESDGSAIASTLHSESDSDLDRKFSIIFTFKYLDFLRDKFLFRMCLLNLRITFRYLYLGIIDPIDTRMETVIDQNILRNRDPSCGHE